MDDFERLALLLDFYGALLTDRQKTTMEEHVCEDLSISEIAEGQGISRQSAHDMIKRSTKILEEYEEKLHLVARFEKIITQVEEIDRTVESDIAEAEKISRIRELTTLVLDEL